MISSLLSIITTIVAHGYLSNLNIRPITSEFREKLPEAMRALSDFELQRYPFEYISQHFNRSNFPDVFTLPCRGLESMVMPMELNARDSVDVEWTIDAVHPGTCTIRCFNASNEPVSDEYLIENCGSAIGAFSQTIRIPDGSACKDQEEGCYIQWFWSTHSNNETYSNCADFVVVT